MKLARRRQQKRHTFEKRLEAANKYAERNGGRQVRQVLHLDFVSDYMSGPETDSEESMEEWKVRMGRKMGMDKRRMGARAWERTKFLERVKPNWRSRKVSSNMLQRD
jgi:hypothetical protein